MGNYIFQEEHHRKWWNLIKLFQGEGGGTIFGEPFHLVEEVVHLDSLELREHEGMVISIDFEAEA